VLTSSQGPFCFSSHHTSERAGDVQEVGRGQPTHLTPNDHRDIPSHRTLFSAIKSGGKKKGRGNVQSDGICLPKLMLRVMGPSFPGDG